MAEEDGYYVEDHRPRWRSSFNHQKLPDPEARTAKVIPKHRLVTKKGRYFTTDTSDRQRASELSAQNMRKMQMAHPNNAKVNEVPTQKKQQFIGKNA
jgi:hypothetical protein